jgi:hypothetical protein
VIPTGVAGFLGPIGLKILSLNLLAIAWRSREYKVSPVSDVNVTAILKLKDQK